MPHPSDESLIRFLLDREMPASVRGRVERHTAEGCPRCTARLGELTELVRTMREDRSAEPPAEWVDRALRAFSRSPIRDRVRKWCAGMRETVAQLVFDSATPGLSPAGVRHVDAGRRLRFESHGYELDVQIEIVGKGGTVTGQVLRIGSRLAPVGDARYLVTAADSDLVTGVTDEFGEFTVEIARIEDLRIRVVVDDGLATFVVPDCASGA